MRNNKGFTIVEIIMSVVIIGVCLLAIVLVYQQVLNNGHTLRSITVATGLAEEKLEEIVSSEYADVSSEYSTFTEPFAAYSYSTTAYYVQDTALDTPYGSDTGYKRVDVNVSASDGTSVELSTLVTD